jgi:hypothetical protein
MGQQLAVPAAELGKSAAVNHSAGASKAHSGTGKQLAVSGEHGSCDAHPHASAHGHNTHDADHADDANNAGARQRCDNS